MGLPIEYDARALTQEARRAVKGKGRYAGWALLVHQTGVVLRVFYQPRDVQPGGRECVDLTLRSLDVAI